MEAFIIIVIFILIFIIGIKLDSPTPTPSKKVKEPQNILIDVNKARVTEKDSENVAVLKTSKDIFSNPPANIGKLNKIATNKSPKPIKNISEEPFDNIEITNQYKLVKQLIENKHPIIFISGKAGTGKSTLIRFLRNSLLGKNIVVVAPTGVAALNISGATINSYFRFPPRIITSDDIKEVKDRRLYINLQLLIIDEISMVRVDLIDAIDKFLRLNGPKKNFPFGGVQLVFIGDLFQLPPVVDRNAMQALSSQNYSSPYFFSAKSLEYCQLIPIELTKIFRQKDADFTNMLNYVRVAEKLENILPLINARTNQNIQNGEFVITLTTRNDDADQINTTELSKLITESKTFIGQATGKFALENEQLPSPIELILKVGALVMFTKNDSGKQWVNGTMGKVISFKDNSIQVQIYKNNIETIIDVGMVTWKSFAYTLSVTENKIMPYVTGEYSQIPLMLAWAITIHKSQGKTLDKIKIDIGNGAFASGQVYVALSRTRSLLDLSLAKPIKVSDIKCDQEIKRFYLALQTTQEKISRLADDPKSEGFVLTNNQCPYCWGELRERNGKHGLFLGCSNYPKCTYTRDK